MRPHDWPIVSDQYVIENMNSFEYPFATLSYKEFGSMNELCRAINKKNSARKNDDIQLNYSKEEGKIYIISPIDNVKIIFKDNLREVLGFKHDVINGKSAGSAMNRVIFAEYSPTFSSHSCIFL